VAELAELLHRVSTTSADRADDNPISSLTPDLQSILQQAQQFTEQRVPWHHHVLFPDCILNDTPGAWKVLIEGNGAILSATAADEPTQLLSELEPLFYSQSAK
jgi:hypothetical protein